MGFIIKIPKITRDVLKRGFNYSLTALVIYFLIKSPITVLLTDYLHIWYIFSGAISGIVVTILTFIPTEFWVFKDKNKEKSKRKVAAL